MATQKLVGENALSAIATDIKTAIGTKADASNTYTKTEVDTALGLKANSADVYNKSEIDTAMEGKADIDGEYDLMVVGNAKQLKSNVGENDKVPYLIRTSGGSIDIGDRETDMLVGGTVALNQKCVDGDFPNNTTAWQAANSTVSYSNNKATMLATTQNGYLGNFFDNTTGHCYLIMATIDTTVANKISLRVLRTVSPYDSKNISNTSGSKQTISMIHKTSYDTARYEIRIVDARTSDWDNVVVSNVNIIDLTQMFGATIADYIYSLETGTPGAGVAWFRNLFPKPYYAYNAGGLVSVKTSAHKLVGFNQWDEKWIVGSIDTTTGEITAGDRVVSKNHIPVIANTSYYIMAGVAWVYFYDVNKNLISYAEPNANRLVTTPSNCAFMMFKTNSTYGTTYNHDICINIRWDGERDGEYEPYVKHEYPLDSDLELRGIPKLDANNKLYYDGDTYESDGTVTRRYGIVNTDDLTFTYSSSNKWLSSDAISNAPSVVSGVPDALFELNYEKVDASALSSNDKAWTIYTGKLFIRDTSKTEQELRELIADKLLMYMLSTSTTETADEFTNPQLVDDFGTEEYVDTRAVAIPVGHDTFYQANLRAKLEMAPDSPSGNGDYIVRQTDGQNEYVVLTKELPTLPSTDGTYTLKCTVSSGTASLSWVAD